MSGMISSHRELIQNVRGMPGVCPERLSEAFTPCHCALSLVGEPILYPKINQFIQILHAKSISTFLVTNGQYPEAIPHLSPVTQLYLSVDAPNKAVMETLDRPVFSDFWERFQRSVKYMSERDERTVFRLTLIVGFNMSEKDITEYAALLAAGRPDFVELKRLTPAFQGRVNSLLRMKNVPSWQAVKEFASRLSEATGQRYRVTSVHEHSGCVLLSTSKFILDGVPATWIDFKRFHELAASNGKILPENYWLSTPSWALHDAAAEGFDPSQQRYAPKRKK